LESYNGKYCDVRDMWGLWRITEMLTVKRMTKGVEKRPLGIT